MKTTLVQEKDVERKWLLVDATDVPAGRLAVKIAERLRGKHKRTFAPHIDGGDFVVVINAEKVKFTGKKSTDKIYKDFSGYPSGLKEYTADVIREKNPERIITQAVRGMLPRNNLSRKLMTRLKVYTGTDHPHEAQQPEQVDLLGS